MILITMLFFLLLPQSLSSASEQRFSGYLLFGPYIDLCGGEYDVSFSLKLFTKRRNEPVAKLEVIADSGAKRFAERVITGSEFAKDIQFEEFPMDFKTKGAKGFEFRVITLNNATISIDKVTLTRNRRWSSTEATGSSLIMGASDSELVTGTDFLGKSKRRVLKISDKGFGLGDARVADDPDAYNGKAMISIKPMDPEIASGFKKLVKVRSLSPVIILGLLAIALTGFMVIIIGAASLMGNDGEHADLLSEQSQ
jgi:hypothetical protein